MSSRGRIWPRTLNSPRTDAGAAGTRVTTGSATTSWRATGGSANQSRPTGIRIARVIAASVPLAGGVGGLLEVGGQ